VEEESLNHVGNLALLKESMASVWKTLVARKFGTALNSIAVESPRF
jgi:uncharacterized protein YejL (UPF0352 family)